MASLLFLLAIVLAVLGFGLPPKLHNPNGDPSDLGATRTALKVCSVFALVIAFLGGSYFSVPAGYRGVLLQFGAVNGVLGEGAHFVLPFVQHVETMEVRTQKEQAKASAASRDLQIVTTEVAINYHLDPERVGDLYKRVGPDFASRIIDPATQETVKAVVAQYTAEELIRQREEVKNKIDSSLTARLSNYSIAVESGGVSLTNFDFSPDFNKAIEAKQVAQQTAEQQKYILQKAQMEAETAITKAKGEAEANRIKALALSTVGGTKVLAREWIDKWDGHLPTVSSNGNGMIIDLKSLMDAKDKPGQ
jgi:regulator of protease activity HflC (stomatin/prohibitin superfamily)